MRNQLKKWFAVLMAMVLGMPGYGLSTKNITTKAEDESIVIHIENEERHVQTGETVSLLDGVSVEGSGEESYRAVVGDVQEQDSGLSLYEEGMEELVIPGDAAGKTYRVLYKAQSSIDNEVWNDVEGSEKEALLIVEGSSESEEVTAPEENKEEETNGEESKEEEKQEENKEETPQPVTVTLQGKEKEDAEVGEVFSFVHDVTINCSQENDNTYRIVVRGVDAPENGSYQYQEGDESFVPQKGDEGLTYVVHYGVDVNKDDESHDNQWEQVEGVSFAKEVMVTTVKKVTIQGEEEIIVLAGEEYNFMHDSGLVIKGPKEGTTYRLKVKEVKSPDGGSYSYQEGDESFIPQESDEGLIYEVTYGVEASKDQATWEEVDKVQFTQKIITAVFRPEPVRGPLATEAILCTGQQFNTFVKNWNSGSTIKVKNLVKADVPSDLMTAALRYKYETISDPSSPVKIYMWHDMNAYGQYVDTVYFGTEVPGVTIYTNPDASYMFSGIKFSEYSYDVAFFERLYDSANPSAPYFFNTSKTTNFDNMFEGVRLTTFGIPFDCTNGNGVSPLGLMDTSNATSLSHMFYYSRHLDLTGIENWDVHKVTDINHLFSGLEDSKIPWGIGNWEFDNLLNVESSLTPWSTSETLFYEINITNWDLSHCDSKYMFDSSYSPFKRLGIGSKHIDMNGQFYAPKQSANSSYGHTENGTWQNESTGTQYFQLQSVQTWRTGNGESFTEFSESYLANPVGMSGIYQRGNGFHVRYRSDHDGMPKDAQGNEWRTAFYKNTDTTATLISSPFMWVGHYLKKWKETSVSPSIFRDIGDTVPLNKNYEFEGIWGAHERTITYDLDGGVNNPSNPTKFVAAENTSIYEPTKSGMIFAGWTWTSASKSMPDPWYILSIKSDAGGVGSRNFPDEDVVLKAHWALPRTITIHGNGGTIGSVTEQTITVPDIDISFSYSDIDKAMYIQGRGKSLYQASWQYPNHDYIGIKDNLGNVLSENIPNGVSDLYIQWKLTPKFIYFVFDLHGDDFGLYGGYGIYTNPDGSPGSVNYANGQMIQEYTGKQWDEASPNVTFSLKGHEIGAPNEYIISDFAFGYHDYKFTCGYLFQSFTISSPGSSHTYPTGNLTSYTFTGGFDKNVTITFHSVRAWRVQYVNLDDTPITTMQTLTETDLPYTFRNTYPPHAPWHGFPVIPVGWTIEKYNGGPDATGIYTSTGNLPTLYKGTWDATQFQNSATAFYRLYPMYSVDVNKDGIPDLFQNKNTLTVSKEVVKGQYSDLTSLATKVFPYEITFKDVHGDPIKNWPVEDTNGQTYTTDNSGKVTINLRHQESVTFKGMLVNMIIQAVETDTKGMSAEYAISYNGTSFTSGTDTGSITYQDNTPLTVTFKNTAGGNIVPAGIKDTNTRVYVLLGAVLIALAFSIRMLKVRRRA